MKSISTIASRFDIKGKITRIIEHKEGNVNDTYIVTSSSEKSGQIRYVLQRINSEVFSDTSAILKNLVAISTYLEHSLKKTASPSHRQLEIPQVISSKNGESHFTDPEGNFWRMISYIENSRTLQTITTPQQAEELGIALGLFHSSLAGIEQNLLVDTLPGFHITPEYLVEFDKAELKTNRVNSTEKRYCSKFIDKRRHQADVLESAKTKRLIRQQVIHGDPKINNFLFDEAADKTIGIIDLDTVKPGLIHYDIGDCLRSSSNPAGEETLVLDEVDFDLHSVQGFFKGYASTTGPNLSKRDVALFAQSVWLMTFELGLRFFTDYLKGDVYFKTARDKHNLDRALVQFRLTEIIESKMDRLDKIISDVFNSN